jgi:hypothetical protein
VIQVAEFEPPRFTVDVDASLAANNTLRAKVLGKYLFGAAMDKAERRVDPEPRGRRAAPGPVHRRRLSLRRRPLRWWDEDSEEERGWSRAGSGELGPDGTLAVTQKLDLGDAVGSAEVHLRGRRRRQLVPPHRRARQRGRPPDPSATSA